jgi:hypothetical protein
MTIRTFSPGGGSLSPVAWSYLEETAPPRCGRAGPGFPSLLGRKKTEDEEEGREGQ